MGNVGKGNLEGIPVTHAPTNKEGVLSGYRKFREEDFYLEVLYPDGDRCFVHIDNISFSGQAYEAYIKKGE